jgi:hypothetical protein
MELNFSITMRYKYLNCSLNQYFRNDLTQKSAKVRQTNTKVLYSWQYGP